MEFHHTDREGQIAEELAQNQPDLDYLQDDKTAAQQMIEDVKQKVATMKGLQAKMLEAEAVYEQAKKDFEHYRDSVVITAMTSSGIHGIMDEYGNEIRLESKFYCSPNKNDADRALIEAWLRQHGGDFLLKAQGIVDGTQLEQLKGTGIPFQQKTDINTNSLKSFLLDLLGMKAGSMARIKLEDIPAQMHFQMMQEVVVA